MKMGHFPMETVLRILPVSKRILLDTAKWRLKLMKGVDHYKSYVLCENPQL